VKPDWVSVLDLNEASLDAPQAVEVAGEDLVILRHADRYVAMDRWCPHERGDLAEGRVLGRALKCPLHGFMFSLDAGRGLNCRGFQVTVHEVKVEDGVLSVRLAR
jgi:nitrite reductase/ring-hydroxylating ferredoxin subunit